MMTRSTLILLGALAAVVGGCDSEVQGGGGGAGGSGSGSAESTGDPSGPSTGTGSGTGTTQATSGTDVTSGTGTGTASGTTSGPGTGTGTSTGTGTGGGNALGECEQQGGTAASSGSGGFMCEADFTCDGGNPNVSCTNDGTTETCDCFLDGNFAGSCIDEDQSGCSFPQNCCFNLLGGHVEPNPGPYGTCESTSGSAQATTGGEQECGTYYDCTGGEMEIECSQTAGGDAATCDCIDGNGFLIGTCEQPSLDCDYQSNCCYDIFN